MNTIRYSGMRQLAFGSFLAILWAAGLFGVLEADSLAAKALLLALLAPLSLGLDRRQLHVLTVVPPVAGGPDGVADAGGLQPGRLLVEEHPAVGLGRFGGRGGLLHKASSNKRSRKVSEGRDKDNN